jgi:hypothetical protein
MIGYVILMMRLKPKNEPINPHRQIKGVVKEGFTLSGKTFLIR